MLDESTAGNLIKLSDVYVGMLIYFNNSNHVYFEVPIEQFNTEKILFAPCVTIFVYD